MLIDAHNHLQDPRFNGHTNNIVAAMKEVGIATCVVNGTEPSDWTAVADLAQRHSNFVLPSFGLHPWKIKGRADDWRQQLEDVLQRHPDAGVGEIGLDRWIDDYDIEDQKSVFRQQLNLAGTLQRPCTIHCLKAWGILIDELQACDRLPRILIHSFGGSIETAKQLLSLGCWFSFSGYFLHARKSAIIDVFRQLPADRILIETDAPDMALPEDEQEFRNSQFNHPANLRRISQRVVEQIGVSVEQLAENTNHWWQGSGR